jgi:CRISPR-associated protein Cmr4
VDLPIVRERTTNWPIIPGSAIKGVLADHYGASVPDSRDAVSQAAFGKPDTTDTQGVQQGANAGALQFSDARLAAFPVRSVFGTWAWVTCPLALRRLLRDLEQAKMAGNLGQNIPSPGATELLVGQLTATKLFQSQQPQQGQRGQQGQQQKAYLADLDLNVSQDSKVQEWASKLATWLFPNRNGQADPWATEFQARFGVLSEDLFNYLAETATEVATRIRVDPATGVVAKGQLWVEEALPAESILVSYVWVDRITAPQTQASERAILNAYCTNPLRLQIGGKSTVGRGQTRCVFSAPPQQG